MSGVAELKQLPFYHGVQTKDEVNTLMKDSVIGDYLIRATFLKTEVALAMFLCVKVTEKVIHHYFINYSGEKFVIKQEFDTVNQDSPQFSNYDEMVSYYKMHRLACGIRLNRFVKRLKWQLRHTELQYEETAKLGSGNFCHVYRGKLVRKGDIEKEAAIKVSKLTDKDPTVLMNARNDLVAEAKIMTSYNHEHVVRFLGLACDMPPFIICMEFCVGGSLESHLLKNGKEMEEFERQSFLIDAARGMRYLHKKKCIHRDLAARNCLISSRGVVKIADFGLSKTLDGDQNKVKEALKEAPLVWMAPECIQKESEFSMKTDVWAYGTLMYETYYNGGKPFEDEQDTSVIVKSIRRAKMPGLENRTKVAAMDKLLSEIWEKNPASRPTFSKILEDIVTAIVPHNLSDVKKMQVNKLNGVKRTKAPNLELEEEVSQAVISFDYDVSENNRRKKAKPRTSRSSQNRSSRRRKRRSMRGTVKKTSCEFLNNENEEQPN